MQQPPKNAEHAFEVARLLAQCAALTREDANLAETDRKKAEQFYANRTVELLRQAVKLGLRDVKLLTKEEDFDSIRSHLGYLEIVKQLE